jgi:hypothetical protein
MKDPLDNELAEYRVLAGQAVAALLLGLLSPIAFVDPFLLVVPALGVFFGVWAVRRIRGNATAMAGRKRAIFGLVVSLMVVVAVPVHWFVAREMFCKEARQFADTWFKHVVEDRPEKAVSMTYIPEPKQPALGQEKPDKPEKSPLELFVSNRVVKTLMTFGPRAQVRFYQRGEVGSERSSETVELWYAVTYDNTAAGGGSPEKTSFFVVVTIQRQILMNGDISWKLLGLGAGNKPNGW